MNSHITNRRRLFVLLAGFFGFLTPTAIAGVSGPVASEVLGTAPAGADIGAACLACGTASAEITHGPAVVAVADQGVRSVVRDVVQAPSARAYQALSTVSGRSTERVQAAEVMAPPEAVFLSSVQRRGPPSGTDSDVLIR